MHQNIYTYSSDKIWCEFKKNCGKIFVRDDNDQKNNNATQNAKRSEETVANGREMVLRWNCFRQKNSAAVFFVKKIGFEFNRKTLRGGFRESVAVSRYFITVPVRHGTAKQLKFWLLSVFRSAEDLTTRVFSTFIRHLDSQPENEHRSVDLTRSPFITVPLLTFFGIFASFASKGLCRFFF